MHKYIDGLLYNLNYINYGLKARQLLLIFLKTLTKMYIVTMINSYLLQYLRTACSVFIKSLNIG